MSLKRTLSLSQGTDYSYYMSMPAKTLKSSKGLLKGGVKRPYVARKGSVKKANAPVTKRQAAAIAKRVLDRTVETKYLDSDQTGQTVGQVNVDATGHNSITFSYPSQGTAANQRIGDTIKLKRLIISTQYWGMANTSAPVKMQCYLVWMKGKTSGQVNIANFLDQNLSLETLNAVDIYDTGSLRNLETNDFIKVLAAWEVFLPRLDNTSASTANNVSHTFVQKDIPLNLVQKFDAGGSVNSLVLYTVADSGNRGGSASTLTGLPMNTASTGVQFQRNFRLEFQDA